MGKQSDHANWENRYRREMRRSLLLTGLLTVSVLLNGAYFFGLDAWFLDIRPGSERLSKTDLVAESIRLGEDLSLFVMNRKMMEPAVDFWNETEREVYNSFQAETLGQYYSDYYFRVADIRKEYRRRHVRTDGLDIYYQNPTNLLGIQRVSTELFDIAARINSLADD